MGVMKLSHYQTGEITCKECSETFPHSQALKNHKKVVHPVHCSECTAVLTSEGGLLLHTEDKHTPFPCDCCGDIYPGGVALGSRLSVIHNKFLCAQCPAVFPSGEERKVHASLQPRPRLASAGYPTPRPENPSSSSDLQQQSGNESTSSKDSKPSPRKTQMRSQILHGQVSGQIFTSHTLENYWPRPALLA